MSEPTDPTPIASPQVPRAYANAVAVEGGLYDVALTFGVRVGAGGGSVEPGVQVLMSWEHARALVDVLAGLVEKYEAEFGDVRKVEQAAAAIAERGGER